jgi:hypothetical protein
MSSIPDEALILVGVLPETRDLEIARLLGWYRIPLKSAPKVIDVDYLAFYQTGAFGEEHRWRIETICPVRGHELVTRAELFHDEIDHKRANEEYFKISLGSMIQLDSPISAGNWKRITFLYTLGELLNRAQTIHDLVVHSERRQLLWQSLRERLASDRSNAINNVGDDISPDLLFEALKQYIDFPAKKVNKIYQTNH